MHMVDLKKESKGGGRRKGQHKLNKGAKGD